MPELMKGLGVNWPGKVVMQWEQFERRGVHSVQYGTNTRKIITIAKPLLGVSAAIGGVLGATALIRRMRRGPSGANPSSGRASEF